METNNESRKERRKDIYKSCTPQNKTKNRENGEREKSKQTCIKEEFIPKETAVQ